MNNRGYAGASRLQFVSDVFPGSSNPTDPSFVEGRQRELRDAILTILTPRMCPVILGAKGMGKTTFAWQVELAVKGNMDILDHLGLTAYRSPAEYFHEIVWLNCANLKSPNGRGILAAIVDSLRNRYKAVVPADKMATVERSTTVSFSMTPSLQFSNRSALQSGSPNDDIPVEEEILELATEIAARTGHPFLFIIDDAHLLEDAYAFSSFLKNSSSYSPTNPRFVLVGTADRLGDLLLDVRDIGGIVASIELGRMRDDEVLELLQWGIRRLWALGFRFEVEDGLLESLAHISAGHPATASQLARGALIAAERDGATRITRRYLDDALRNLIAGLLPSASRRVH
jgi:hypothetical protein